MEDTFSTFENDKPYPDKPEFKIDDLWHRSPRRRRYNPYEPEAKIFNLAIT
jgi:hypothetical protein